MHVFILIKEDLATAPRIIDLVLFVSAFRQSTGPIKSTRSARLGLAS